MRVFIDTNVLLRSADPADPRHDAAVKVIEELIGSGQALVITPQIAAEFWNVATRPVANNGLAMSTEEAREEIVRLEGFFSMLDESVEVYAEWKKLVLSLAVKGVQVHDARIVAAMNVYGVTRLVTFNPSDFKRYSGIQVVTPAQWERRSPKDDRRWGLAVRAFRDCRPGPAERADEDDPFTGCLSPRRPARMNNALGPDFQEGLT
jgi:predicted nucleic acid-binding protein